MMVILARRVPRPSWEMSNPSMARDPEAASLILYKGWYEIVDWVLLYKRGCCKTMTSCLKRERVRDDLPLPVLPTIPTWQETLERE